jgi:hypothetical protein
VQIFRYTPEKRYTGARERAGKPGRAQLDTLCTQKEFAGWMSEESEVTVESRPLPPSACFALHHCVKSVLGYCAFGHWSQLVRRAELLHRAESRADFLAVCYSDLLCCFELREIGFDACFRLHCCNGQRE